MSGNNHEQGSGGCLHKRSKKTGIITCSRKRPWLIWLLPVAGLVSLIWFLIRVLPKPSRAAYPCQRLAAPLASSFVILIVGLVSSTLVYRKGRRLLEKSRHMFAAVLAFAAVAIIWCALCVSHSNPADAVVFTPTEPANSPIGEAKGIHPGRVAWIRDPDATSWDGSAGNWWDDENTDRKIVDAMVSEAIQQLTGEATDSKAWEALFRHFNRSRGFGDVGYQKSERIAIKINMNQDRRSQWKPDVANPSPQVVRSLVDQLVNKAGVRGSAITIYDATRYVGDPIYNKIKNDGNAEFREVSFVVVPDTAQNGRLAAVPDTSSPLHTKAGTVYLPRCVTQAKYMINLALFRAHTLFGVTLCAKNHFGSTYFPNGRGWSPSPLHKYGSRQDPMGSYSCLVNLNGHRQLDGKTLLYMIDGLYPARNQTSGVIRFASYDDDWFSSILVSQDMVAIDSVGLDILLKEQSMNPNVVDVTGNPDNYLHEAASANSPASGAKYDPEDDGTTLGSLGVHEHWNDAKEMKYSRNLGTGRGIELVTRN